MAKISAAANERIYQIKKWLGVNEAPEGDARLRTGEAAVMRNFRVTAGGALRKRGGSLNVAGLMSEYVTSVDSGTEETLVSMFGTPETLVMYPRVGTDSVGIPTGEGTAVTVTAAGAESYSGYYYEHEGTAHQFVRADKTEAEGDNAITGGAVTKGELSKFASGSETNYSGSAAAAGTQSIVTYANISVTGEGTAELGGTETTQERAFADTAGWKTENAGGYISVDGAPWLYYGSKTESYSVKHKWKKYACTKSSSTYYFYIEGNWGSERTVYLSSVTGSVGYSFNPATGVFSDSGGSRTIGWDETGSSSSNTGTVYINSGSSQTRYSYSGGQTMSYSSRSSYPTSGTETSYTVGSYISDVFVTDGDHPEKDRMSYAASFTRDGVAYTVMTDGANYYAYTQDAEDTTDYYICEYAWYGYPLTVTADRYDWIFHPVSSASNGTDSVVRGIWSGFVNGTEVLCAACNGFLWQLSFTGGKWSKTSCGALNTGKDVFMFGFDEKLYMLNGTQYKVWDGTTLSDVAGYRPLVVTASAPGGGGTVLESVNKLNGLRRCRFSPDGTATVFTLPEKGITSVDYVTDLVTGSSMTGWTADTAAGTVTFGAAPAAGTATVEVGWTYPDSDSAKVQAMKYAEIYNGAQDSRVFLYGDGTNQCIYSGLDSSGQPRADYFPDLNVAAVGDENTPITAMIRHYNKLMAFKLDSAYTIYYDTLTLTGGETVAGFYITPVNRSIGNCAPGQAVLVENRPRTLDGRSVIEWKATSTSGTVTGDQRNAQRVSQRVDNTIRLFDLATAKTFYDKYAHEYYVIGSDGTAIVNNVDADAWYIYTNFGASCLINYKDELYFGTADGYLRHVSESYYSDNGEAIDALWESGSMAFDEDYMRKYSAMLWVGVKPENNGYLKITAETDRKSDFAEYSFSTDDASAVPRMNRIKLKAKKFTYYKLILSNNTPDTTVTVVSADVRVRGTGYVR